MDFYSVRFPGETDSYRRARNDLLQAEIDLRRQVEEVAALRRQLPLGGEIPEDYAFEEGSADLSDSQTVRRVSLSQLFQPGKDTLALYSFMFGPKRRRRVRCALPSSTASTPQQSMPASA
jgi:predicted dithiol-disulfide oxidoreductase (DUF899 family)